MAQAGVALFSYALNRREANQQNREEQAALRRTREARAEQSASERASQRESLFLAPSLLQTLGGGGEAMRRRGQLQRRRASGAVANALHEMRAPFRDEGAAWDLMRDRGITGYFRAAGNRRARELEGGLDG